MHFGPEFPMLFGQEDLVGRSSGLDVLSERHGVVRQPADDPEALRQREPVVAKESHPIHAGLDASREARGSAIELGLGNRRCRRWPQIKPAWPTNAWEGFTREARPTRE